jgi:hypothetical protein
VKLSDRDLLAAILLVLVAALTIYRVNVQEGVITLGVLWAVYLLGRSHPPD